MISAMFLQLAIKQSDLPEILTKTRKNSFKQARLRKIKPNK